MGKQINLECIPQPYRDLAIAMHHHGKFQQEHMIRSYHRAVVSYSLADRAWVTGIISGLDFRIAEILHDLRPPKL